MYGTLLAEKLTNAIQNVKILTLRTAILQEWQQFPQERRGVLQNITINAADILVIAVYALHIRTIDAFKSS